MFSNIRLLTVLFIGIFIAVTLLAYHSLNVHGKAPSNQPDTPDSFMEDVSFTRYNAQGMWESRFYTPRSVHYQKRNTTFLENPKLISQGDNSEGSNSSSQNTHPENQLMWVITAKYGKAEDDGKTIYLQTQVQIQRINPITHQVATMNTSALTAYPQKKFLHTDQPVVIIQPGSTVQSVGLNADLQTGNIYLLSKAQSVYAAPN